jgi:hypothetical protein
VGGGPPLARCTSLQRCTRQARARWAAPAAGHSSTSLPLSRRGAPRCHRCSSIVTIGVASTSGVGGGVSWGWRRWSSCITSGVGLANGAASMQLAAFRTLPFARWRWIDAASLLRPCAGQWVGASEFPLGAGPSVGWVGGETVLQPLDAVCDLSFGSPGHPAICQNFGWQGHQGVHGHGGAGPVASIQGGQDFVDESTGDAGPTRPRC